MQTLLKAVLLHVVTGIRKGQPSQYNMHSHYSEYPMSQATKPTI